MPDRPSARELHSPCRAHVVEDAAEEAAVRGRRIGGREEQLKVSVNVTAQMSQ